MSENDGAGQIDQPSIDAAAAAAKPATGTETYVNPDGSFKDGWQSQLDPEIRDDPAVKPYKRWQDGFKSLVNAQRMVGKNKIAVPSANSSQGEWDEYYKAGGRPETAADYGLKAPEGLPGELFPPERLTKWQERFHKAGISKKAADMIISEYAADIGLDLQAHQTDTELAMTELKGGLQRDWGAAYDQNIHLGNLAIEEGVKGNEEFKDRLVAKFGNDPDFIRFASNLGGKFSEAKLIDAKIPTPADLDDQIKTIMNEGGAQGPYMNRDHPRHKDYVAKVQKMFEAKHAKK